MQARLKRFHSDVLIAESLIHDASAGFVKWCVIAIDYSIYYIYYIYIYNTKTSWGWNYEIYSSSEDFHAEAAYVDALGVSG